MKRILYVLIWIGGYLLFLTACKHQVDPVPGEPLQLPEKPVPGEEIGAVQPVGVPQGVAVIKTIGSAGGSIQSEDGRFNVTIPAGALTTDVPISMQPITNTNGAGVGAGYRMLPDGQQFAKPVTMTVTYTREEVERSMPEALGIAYQNAKGIWMAVGGTQIDTTRKTVSIEVNHFTDFTFFEYVYLDPEFSTIDPGQSVSIRLWGLGWINDALHDFPKGKERPLPKPTPIDYLDGWELKGEGSLQGTGKEVTYLAPGQMPNTNPAMIIARVKSPGKEVAQLISRVYVLKEGVWVQAGGGDWVHLPKAGANLRGGIKGIDAENGQQTINIKWRAGDKPADACGLYNWALPTPGVIYRPNSATEYVHLYGTNPDVSGGALSVDELRFGYIYGMFNVTTAGVYVTSVPPSITTSTMRGVFRVKCLDCAR